MRFVLTVAALAGTALAAPHAGRPHKNQGNNVIVEVTTVVKTIYVTEGYEAVKPTPTPSPVYEAPVVTSTVVYEEPKPTSKYEAPAPAPTSEKYEAPAPAPTSEKVEAPAEPTYPASTPAPEPTTTAAPAPTGTGYMAVVDKWRSKMGMAALKCDSKLEANAMDTVVASNGQMVHKLNPGTFGQVLAPGSADDFEHVFVGGWLCEIPTLPGLDGVCTEQSKGWTYQGQTGHAEILTSTNYSKIGCALHAGIWCCDVA